VSSASNRSLTPGARATVFDRYRIMARLESDARGEVYLGDDLEGGPQVELRFLSHPAFRGAASTLWGAIGAGVERVASVDHPNVERVMCAGVTMREGEALVCVAAERVKGDNLHTYLRQRRLALREALAIAVQVARGLAALHDRGVVHGDLRPSRVLLARQGPDDAAGVVLCDVGVNNLLLDAVRDSPALLEIFGPDFVAPEQIEGEATTSATDVYAFGHVLYRMLTGAAPFRAESMRELLIAQLAGAPLALAERGAHDVPAPLEKLVFRCLAKRPKDRYADGQALLDALRPCEELVGPSTFFSLSSDFAAAPSDDGRPSRPTPTASGITSMRPPRIERTPASIGSRPAPPLPEPAALAPAPEPEARPLDAPPSLAAQGRTLLTATLLVLAVGLLGGFAFAVLRRTPPAVAPAPPQALTAQATIRLQVRSSTQGASVVVRGRTFELPLRVEVSPGNAPEMVEVTAPGRAPRRIWMMLDCNTEAQIDLTDNDPAGGDTPAPAAPVNGAAPLTSRVVRQVVEAHASQIEDCLHRARPRNPTMSGQARVTIVIDPSGRVRRATWYAHEPAQLQALGCITSAIRRWTFPASGYGGDFLTVQTFDLD
jgi:serine/threonine-protein kinase